MLVLDEIDRCEPLAAQAMLALSQRFLQGPGILMIMPFVSSQLRFKVFHPGVAALPEIRATSAQILEKQASFQALLRVRSPVVAPGASPKLEDFIWHQSALGSSMTAASDGRSASFISGKEIHPLMQALIIHTYYDNEDEWENFYSQIEDRYIKTAQHPVKDLNEEDFSVLLVNHDGVRSGCLGLARVLELGTNRALDDLVAFHAAQGFGAHPDQGSPPEARFFRALCADVWRQGSNGGKDRNDKPIPLRGLIASLRIALDELATAAARRQRKGGMTESERSALFVVILALALHIALARLV